MIGVILACGRGTRLRPFTKVICKCLLPVYDKPTIYFAIKELTGLGIKEIIVITLNKKHTKAVLSDYKFNAQIYCREVKKPKGPVEVLNSVKRKLKGKKIPCPWENRQTAREQELPMFWHSVECLSRWRLKPVY